MHSIDLNKYNYRTDLVIEKDEKSSSSNVFNYDKGITVDKRVVSDKNYVTISFLDITDKDNYLAVSKVFIKEFKELLGDISKKKVLVVGLGNSKSTPDALGPMTIDNVLVTSHLFQLGEVEEGYVNVCSFKPSVTGVTGIETSSLVSNLVKFLKVDLVIIIDALAARSISRINKTIQITDSGITPGSGVGNYREEISKEKLGVSVIAIGVPTIVDAATIVTDTIKYLLKQLSYKVENVDNAKAKLINEKTYDYSKQDVIFNDKDKERVLGMLGGLNDNELKTLFLEVLTPVNYNLMVTPKEIDFMMEKMGLLIGNGINKSLHSSFNTTK